MSYPSAFTIIKTGFMGVTGLGYTVILPILIGAIVDQLALDRSMVGWISASNISGLAIGGMAATLLIGRVKLLTLIRVACVTLICFELGSAYCRTAESMLIIRCCSGLAGGVLYASSLASFSALEDSIRAFSIYIISYAAVSGVTLFTLPFFIDTIGFEVGFYTLALMGVMSLAFSGVIREFVTGLKIKDFNSLPTLIKDKSVIACLTSYFLLQLGGGVAYTYTERIAKDAAISSEFIGLVLGLGAAVSVMGAFTVIKVGNRYGQRWPMSIAMVMMAASIALLFKSEYAYLFLIGSCMMGAFWSTLLPFYQQMQGQFDTLGRIVTIGTVVNMGGRAAGPALAALTLGDAAYENVLYLSIGAVLLALGLLSPLIWKSESAR